MPSPLARRLEACIFVFFAALVASLPFYKSVPEIFAALTIGCWLVKKLLTREKIQAPGFLIFCYILFLAITFLSLLHVEPENLWTAYRGFVKWLKFTALFFIGFELFKNRDRAEKIVLVFTLSMILISLNGLYQMIEGVDLVRGHSVDIPGRLTRMRSSLASPNLLAAFYLVALPAVFYLWTREKKWSVKSLFWIGVCFLFTLCFALTLSRASVFSLTLALVFFVFMRGQKKLALGIGLAAALFLLSSEITRANFLQSLTLKDITIHERLEFWAAAWPLIREHPFLGHGVNTFYLRFSVWTESIGLYRGYAHNCYLQMWSEIGIFGLLAFLAPLVVVLARELFFKPPLKELRLADALTVGILATLMQSFFDTNWYALQTAYLFWIFWGVLATLEPGL